MNCVKGLLSEKYTTGQYSKLNDEYQSQPSGEIKIKGENFKSRPFLGLFYIIITSVFFTLTSVFVKKLSYINPGHLSFVRNVGVFAGCLPIAIYRVREVLGPKKERLALVIRGFIGATALYLNLTAYRYLPLAEAAIVMSTLPALTTILACIYLKEPCGLIQSFSIVITGCGVLVSVRLPELINKQREHNFDYTYLGGLAAAVGCVITLSILVVALRKMKDIHFSVPLLYFGFLGMVENGAINYFTASFVPPQCGLDAIYVMLIGTVGFVAHCTFTLAIQTEAVGVISVMRASADVIVAMVFQIIFFDGNLDVYNISGACIVVFSVSIIGFRNWLLSLPGESKIRLKFKYLLY